MAAANSTKTAKKNVPGKPFEKGKSGNPRGRPKIPPDVRDMFKAATPAAAKLLIKTIDDEDAPLALRMDAAKTILDRVYGKASQPIEGNGGAAVQVVMSKEVRELMG